MFQKLSAKVYEVAYNASIDMMMSLYENCSDSLAWNSTNIKRYQDCTKQISQSNSMIQNSLSDIESFATNPNSNTSIQIVLDEVVEDVELDPSGANLLEHTINYIRNVSLMSSEAVSCLDIEGCLEKTRELVIR